MLLEHQARSTTRGVETKKAEKPCKPTSSKLELGIFVIWRTTCLSIRSTIRRPKKRTVGKI